MKFLALHLYAHGPEVDRIDLPEGYYLLLACWVIHKLSSMSIRSL